MSKRILVVEDDPATVRLIGYTLEQKGYQVMTALNGKDGLRKAQAEEPDLLILDIMLPELDGFQICRRLRAESRTSRIPVLMLSAKIREVDKTSGIMFGADEYLTKPADPAEVVRQVEYLLARANTGKARTIAFLGSKCGVGTSTVAVNTAVAISQRNRRVILTDLFPHHGMVSSFLGLKPEHTITEVLNIPGGIIDPQQLEAILTTYSTGLMVLPSPHAAEDYREFSLSDTNSLLEALQSIADYILLDVPTHPSEAAKAMLQKCDLVVLVASSWSEGLIDIRSTADLFKKMDIEQQWLATVGIEHQQLALVVVDREGLLTHVVHSEMKPIVESIIHIPFLGIISHDAETFLRFEAHGTPVILTKPNLPIASTLRQLADELIAYNLRAPKESMT